MLGLQCEHARGSLATRGEAQPVSRSPADSQDPDNLPTLTKELLAAYLGGDRDAEIRLFARAHGALIQRARRHPHMRAVSHTCMPEDVVQEVFRRALASGLLRSFEDRGRGSLDSLLEKVLDNTLVDIARREGSLKRGGARPPVALEPQGARDDVRQLAADETTPTSAARSRELLEWARSQLEPREFELWRAVELDGRTSVELAAAVNSTPSAVRGVVFRAQRKLISAMERSGLGLRSHEAR